MLTFYFAKIFAFVQKIWYHIVVENFEYKITIYTDGACSGNPGIGGYGVVIMMGELYKEFSGAEDNTTNNRMELMAIIKGLSALKFPCEVDLFSDSAYCVNAFEQGWLKSWQANNWKGADKKPVKNQDLWQELVRLTALHKVTFHKVKGHADNEFNNRCDHLATTAIKNFRGEQ